MGDVIAIIGVINGDTRSLDQSSYRDRQRIRAFIPS